MNRKIYQGDCLEVLDSDEFLGKIDLIYLDPPYNTGRDFGEFGDKWESDEDYLSYIVERLSLLHRCLKPSGSLYLHCDPTMSHYLKVEADRIFGRDNFRNEIIWCYRGGGVPKRDFARKHDVILRYGFGDFVFNIDAVRIPFSDDSVERLKYRSRSFRSSGTYESYRPNPEGKHLEDWWVLQPLMPSEKERTGYPTQKPVELLDRIIKASSNPGDLILDPFCGSGTTLVVAEKLQRRWVGIDINEKAVDLSYRRIFPHFRHLGLLEIRRRLSSRSEDPRIFPGGLLDIL